MSPSPVIDVRLACLGDETALIAMDELASSDPDRRNSIIDAVHAGQCLLASHGGEPAGYAISNLTFFGRPLIWLLFVRQDRRRSGIGSTRVRYVSRSCPSGRLFTSANESNEPMHRLLGKLGFERSGFVDNLDEGDPEIIYVRHPLPSKDDDGDEHEGNHGDRRNLVG